MYREVGRTTGEVKYIREMKGTKNNITIKWLAYGKKINRNFGKIAGRFCIVIQMNKVRDFKLSGISDQILGPIYFGTNIICDQYKFGTNIISGPIRKLTQRCFHYESWVIKQCIVIFLCLIVNVSKAICCYALRLGPRLVAMFQSSQITQPRHSPKQTFYCTHCSTEFFLGRRIHFRWFGFNWWKTQTDCSLKKA